MPHQAVHLVPQEHQAPQEHLVTQVQVVHQEQAVTQVLVVHLELQVTRVQAVHQVLQELTVLQVLVEQAEKMEFQLMDSVQNILHLQHQQTQVQVNLDLTPLTLLQLLKFILVRLI